MKRSQAESITVRAFEPADETAVLQLLREAFGTWPRGISGVPARDFFRWKTLGCPFGASLSLVAERERQIIGFVARLPWPLLAGGRTVTTMRGVDLAVHPAHRRRGTSLAMIRAFRETLPADVAFTWNNPNSLSRGGLRQVGRRELLSVPRLIRPGRGLRPRRGRARATAARGDARPSIEAQTAAEVLRDERCVSALLERPSEPSERLVTARTPSYLRWRYGHFEDYRAIRLGAEPAEGGMVIFRLRRRRSFWFAEVCELLAPSAHTARELVRRVKRAAPVDFICCAMPDRLQAARSGFVMQAGAIELTVRTVGAQLPLDPARRASWGLSLGDLELL
jgi:hypothetical protein